MEYELDKVTKAEWRSYSDSGMRPLECHLTRRVILGAGVRIIVKSHRRPKSDLVRSFIEI